MPVGERFQRSRRIVFGIGGDRIHKQTAAEPIPKQLLNPGEISTHREIGFALHGHEVDHHHLAPNQIVVKQCSSTLVGLHDDVWEEMGKRPVVRT
jgi:hypothetical protein